MASPEELTTFLRNDTSASMMASGFLGSAGSDKTQSSIIFTLNNMLAGIATNKNICYVLTGDDFVLTWLIRKILRCLRSVTTMLYRVSYLQ